jgi:hypothetical protein
VIKGGVLSFADENYVIFCRDGSGEEGKGGSHRKFGRGVLYSAAPMNRQSRELMIIMTANRTLPDTVSVPKPSR